MIREYLGQKVAGKLDKSRFGATKAGKITAMVLDDDRLVDIGYDRLRSAESHPYPRRRMPILAAGANAVSWLSVIILPFFVAKVVLLITLILPKGGMLLLAPTLGLTLFGVYSLLRVWFPERVYGPDDGVILQSYGRDLESLRTWKLWLVSSGVAGIDVILLWAAYLVRTGEYEYYERVGEFPWDLYF